MSIEMHNHDGNDSDGFYDVKESNKTSLTQFLTSTERNWSPKQFFSEHLIWSTTLLGVLYMHGLEIRYTKMEDAYS
jgi:hypothetical protein